MEHRAAIAFVLLSSAAFAVQDAVVKLLAESGSIWQMQFLRALVVIAIILVSGRILGRRSGFWPNRPFWPFVRAALMSLSYLSYYTAIPYIPLSEAAAAIFTSPIFTCLFAALFLGERIGRWRIAAIAVGFGGVMMILQPGGDLFRPILLLPVFAAMTYSAAQVLTRAKCREEPSFALTVTHNVFYAMVGLAGVLLIPFHPFGEAMTRDLPFLLVGWAPLTVGLATLILATSFSHIVGMTASIRAYQTAPASTAAPFEYGYIVWATLIDLTIWGALPGARVWAGGALIIAAGVVIALRSGRSPPRPLASNRVPR